MPQHSSPLQKTLLSCLVTASAIGCAIAQSPQWDAKPGFITGEYTGTSFESASLINEVVGAVPYYNSGYFGAGIVIANVEAGHIWAGHEVFDREGFSRPNAVSQTVTGSGATGAVDFHATMVGQVLSGAGFIEDESGPAFSYAGIGMAPFAELWSGAIATEFSSTEIGSFSTTTESVLSTYRPFFTGSGMPDGRKADVINSSWGGSDPAATSPEILTIDALARENSTVAFVVAAGNEGASTVSAPGSGYNNITVGSLGGPDLLTPSEFSSRGKTDFFNPETGRTETAVRASVDIAAPGEQLFLAAYLGPTGSLATQEDLVMDPSPSDLYFIDQNGTSFASPTVAGGIALIKEASRDLAPAPEANDTRVIKSALMAGARETVGWDNGQIIGDDGVIITVQSLDLATGAGAMDLMGTADVLFFGGTQDISGLGGGAISASGWDFGQVGREASNDYAFINPFEGEVELTVSLNWFANTSLNEQNLGEALSFSNLNLEVWLVVDGTFSTLIAQSSSLYNNTEFLRIDLNSTGVYGLRVVFDDVIYDLTDSVESEAYGLAWRTQAIPEPGTVALLAIALVALVTLRRRFRRSMHASFPEV